MMQVWPPWVPELGVYHKAEIKVSQGPTVSFKDITNEEKDLVLGSVQQLLVQYSSSWAVGPRAQISLLIGC